MPHHSMRVVATVCLLAATASCSDFLKVANPDVIDAGTLDGGDPVVLDVFARSAQTAFASAYGDVIRFGAIFTTEVQYVDSSEPESQFGVRSVSPVNLVVPVSLWGPLSSARVQSDRVLQLLRRAPGGEANLNGVRAALFSGFSILLMAETFCEGTLADVASNRPGGPLTTAQLLDTASARLGQAIDIATRVAPTLTGAVLQEANGFLNAARVGRARAALQRGNRAQVLTDAALVPAGFTLSLAYVDDASNRTRVSNRLWQFTQARGQLSVAPAYRALADARVTFLAPVATLPSVDGTPLFAQQKYPAYNAPTRLASRLEADYLVAEAQLPVAAPALTLIAARRIAGGQPPYAGAVDSASVLAELMDQRGRDFYLEGKRIGDLRRAGDTYRNEALLRQMLPTGSAYFNKPGLGTVGNQRCVPLPDTERLNNPNFQ